MCVLMKVIYSTAHKYHSVLKGMIFKKESGNQGLEMYSKCRESGLP